MYCLILSIRGNCIREDHKESFGGTAGHARRAHVREQRVRPLGLRTFPGRCCCCAGRRQDGEHRHHHLERRKLKYLYAPFSPSLLPDSSLPWGLCALPFFSFPHLLLLPPLLIASGIVVVVVVAAVVAAQADVSFALAAPFAPQCMKMLLCLKLYYLFIILITMMLFFFAFAFCSFFPSFFLHHSFFLFQNCSSSSQHQRSKPLSLFLSCHPSP